MYISGTEDHYITQHVKIYSKQTCSGVYKRNKKRTGLLMDFRMYTLPKILFVTANWSGDLQVAHCSVNLL